MKTWLPIHTQNTIHTQKGPEREGRAEEVGGMGRMTRPRLC